MMLLLRPLLLRLLLLPVLALPGGAMAQGWLASSAGQQPEFLEARDVFKVEAIAGDDGLTRLSGTIAPGYYLYRHRLSVIADGGAALPLQLSNGKSKTDEFFGRTEVYYDAVDIRVDGGGARSATLHWQGCADAGICYPPQTMRVELPKVELAPAAAKATVAAAATAATVTSTADAPDNGAAQAPSALPAPTVATGSAANVAPIPATTGPLVALAPGAAGEDQRLASRLADASLFVSVAVFFGMGLLLAFTPCTLPMIPIVSSLVVGGLPTARRALALSAAYVLPMALTYAALGVAAGLAGANLQSRFPQSLVGHCHDAPVEHVLSYDQVHLTEEALSRECGAEAWEASAGNSQP